MIYSVISMQFIPIENLAKLYYKYTNFIFLRSYFLNLNPCPSLFRSRIHFAAEIKKKEG